MKFFPMFLRVADRDVVIVGGGEQAAQKARLLLKTEARITLIAPKLEDELAALVAEGRARHDANAVSASALRGAALVFVCTEDAAYDAQVHQIARAAGALVNVVDRPELCEATTPSIVDRDPLVVAIGTEGAGPVLARQIKTRLEEQLEPRLGEMVTLAGRLRDAVAEKVPEAKRRALWRWFFLGQPRKLFARGAEREAAAALKAAINAGGAPDTPARGSIAIIHAPRGAADLLTLRAVQRLQEADAIYYDDPTDEDVLELARRDAQRVCFAQDPQRAMDAPARAQAMMHAAQSGAQVVRVVRGKEPADLAHLDGDLLERLPHISDAP